MSLFAIFWNILEMCKSIEYLFIYKNIYESENCNLAMKYFGIIDKNFAAIFQLQWKIGNISNIFLQYSVLCGRKSSVFAQCWADGQFLHEIVPSCVISGFITFPQWEYLLKIHY